MGTNMYPSSSLLGEVRDGEFAALPVDELIEKADGFAGVFPGKLCADCQVILYAMAVLNPLVSSIQSTSMKLCGDFKAENIYVG